MKRWIFTERPVVVSATRLIMPELKLAEVVGRADIPLALVRLKKGDIVVGNIDVPGLAKITERGARFLNFGVSASKERLDEETPTAEQLVSSDFKGRVQEFVCYKDISAELSGEVEVYSNQLTAQICHFLYEKGVHTAYVDHVHPSQAEVVEGLRATGMKVRVEAREGMGRLGRADWSKKTVVGHMMPRHATEYCTAGADYFHFELPSRPANKHNHAWTLDECREFGATFVKYDVWRYGKTVQIF